MEEKILKQIVNELKTLNSNFRLLQSDMYNPKRAGDYHYDNISQEYNNAKVKIDLLLQLLMK